jgi:hypothetical protein
LADWTKTIDCPEGRVYQDVRRYPQRLEFCELLLPGSLKVQDGPSRWWYSEGRLGEEGVYRMGRKVGRWKECDRFDHCRVQTYNVLDPHEKARRVKPEIPVSYSNGKYVFDFDSCWSTWVTRQNAESFVELNIAGGLIRCNVTNIPSTAKDRPFPNGGYLCEIPYSVGTREFDSLDLRKELPKVGLPQFCREDEVPDNGRASDGPAAQAFAIWVNTRFINAVTGKPVRAWTVVANIVDVECAALQRQQHGPDCLTVRLNEYAEKLVLDRMGKEEIKADACAGQFPLSAIATVRDPFGRALFTYGFSQDPVIAERQRLCITRQTKLQETCATR